MFHSWMEILLMKPTSSTATQSYTQVRDTFFKHAWHQLYIVQYKLTDKLRRMEKKSAKYNVYILNAANSIRIA
jgi:hypothetical protein